MNPERRKVHQFDTTTYGIHDRERAVIEYRDWLKGLPGELLSEGPAWWDDRIRVAITIQRIPANPGLHQVHVS